MAASPFYFVHITDTHLNAPIKDSFLKLDTAAHLREVLAQVRTLAFKPAFVVITGDLAHEGDAEDYRFIKQLLDEESAALGAPILVALGNHDHRDAFNEGYLGQLNRDAAHYAVHDFDGVRVVILDSHWVGSHSGKLDDEQLAWLKQQLATDSVHGTLLFVHHPPHTNTFFADTSHLLTNSDALAEAIEGSDVVGILSGHVHLNSVSAFSKVLSVTGQATAFGLDGTETRGMRMVEAYGYNLCILKDGMLTVQPYEMPSSRREVLFMTFEQLQAAMQHNTAEEALTAHVNGNERDGQ
jgi:3',5'-cyclic AMP phosphodiesterase CpdA